MIYEFAVGSTQPSAMVTPAALIKDPAPTLPSIVQSLQEELVVPNKQNYGASHAVAHLMPHANSSTDPVVEVPLDVPVVQAAQIAEPSAYC
jgi:hypothetical protein